MLLTSISLTINDTGHIFMCPLAISMALWKKPSVWKKSLVKSPAHRWQTQGPRAKSSPPTLFYPTRHLVSTQRQCQAFCPSLRSSYIYTVLKLHSALQRQPRGSCGPPHRENVFDTLQPICKSDYGRGGGGGGGVDARSSLYLFTINPLFDIWFTNIFSDSAVHLPLC